MKLYTHIRDDSVLFVKESDKEKTSSRLSSFFSKAKEPVSSKLHMGDVKMYFCSRNLIRTRPHPTKRLRNQSVGGYY